jgi:hypothetical protein
LDGSALKSGSIEFNGRTIACLIRNQSDTGAALEVVSPLGIPAQFTLLIVADRLRCWVHCDMANPALNRRQIPLSLFDGGITPPEFRV